MGWTTKDNHVKLQELKSICQDFIKKQYEKQLESSWLHKVTDLKNNQPGIYIIIYDSGRFKVGMSHNCLDRVDRQGEKFALLALTLEDLKRLIPTKFVQAIKQLNLPGITFHQDHASYHDALILLQLGEMFLACSRDCGTQTVLERLIQVPSKRVSKLIAPKQIPKDAQAFMQNIS